MSDTPERRLPETFRQGPLQGAELIGEVTEALHRWLLDGWPEGAGPPPRIEENLSFVPKDREEILYVYMYRVARNESLMNAKQWRPSILSLNKLDKNTDDDVLYERPPLFLHLFYMVAVHSRFRSEAERLLGWVMMRLSDASHLIYRPRRYILPSGDVVDSLGKPWTLETREDGVEMEKVALGMVDDFSIGDAINFFTINEAPFRPFLTYRAMCAMRGRLLSGPATQVRSLRPEPWHTHPPGERPGGRMVPGHQPPGAGSGAPKQIGPPGYGHRPIEDNESED